MIDPRSQLQTLLQLILATQPDEIDCDDFLDQISGVFEALDDDAEPPPELAAVRQHLNVCPECKAEYDALVRAFGS